MIRRLLAWWRRPRRRLVDRLLDPPTDGIHLDYLSKEDPQ